MPFGYLSSVVLVSWGVACALARWRRLGWFSAIPALVVSELPFIVGCLLIASSHPVSYAELPGAHHDFDLYESIRSAAVSTAVEQFTAARWPGRGRR